MQLEVDQATERLKEGRKGLEMYRGLVETVARQVAAGKSNIVQLEAQIKAHLKAGNRDVAGQLAIQLQKAQTELARTTSSSSRCTSRPIRTTCSRFRRRTKTS